MAAFEEPLPVWRVEVVKESLSDCKLILFQVFWGDFFFPFLFKNFSLILFRKTCLLDRVSCGPNWP